MGRARKFSPEVREWATRMVLEHQEEHPSQWAAIGSIAAKIGCTAETLRKWVRQVERDAGRRPGLTTEERQRLEDLDLRLISARPGEELTLSVARAEGQRAVKLTVPGMKH